MKKIRASYQASEGVYGSPRVHRDLREDVLDDHAAGCSLSGPTSFPRALVGLHARFSLNVMRMPPSQ